MCAKMLKGMKCQQQVKVCVRVSNLVYIIMMSKYLSVYEIFFFIDGHAD